MKKLIILFFLVALNLQAHAQPIIAIFGTSIEYGYGVNPLESWPYLFKMKLNGQYQIKNYGVIGSTYCVSNNPITPHKNQVQEAYIVLLGGPTNDGAYSNQPQANINFKSRYQGWIDSIKKWNPDATIYCITAIKVNPNPYISQANIDLRNMQVRYLAQLNGLTVWSADQLPASILSSDGVHPNAAGYETMATFFYKEFSHRDHFKPVEELPEAPSENRVPLWPGCYLLISGKNRTLHKF
jgi:lysophospholipase L1-like esterase